MMNLEKTIEMLRRLPADSQAAIASLVEQLARGMDLDLSSGHADPLENIGAWVARMIGERKSKRTIDMYRYMAERFLKKFPRPTRLDVQGYIAGRLEGGTSPAGVENERKSLTSLFKFLVEENLWPEDPTAGLKHIRVPYSEKKPPPEGDILRVLEVGFMRAQDADKMKTIVTLLATTGLRLTECLTARKADIDTDARTMGVMGKGAKWRIVPLVESTVSQLVWFMEVQPSDSPFLFPGEGKSGHAEIHNIEKTLKRACVRAGVEPFTPHQLRHFFATESLRNGAKLDVVSRILGHADAGITSRIYRHIDQDEMAEEADRHAPLNGESHNGEDGEGGDQVPTENGR